MNVRKFREPAIRAEWSKLLQLALTNIPDGSVAEQKGGLDPVELQRAASASGNGSGAVSGSNMQGCCDSVTGAAADGDLDMEPRGDLKEVAGDSTDVPVEMAGCDSDLLTEADRSGFMQNRRIAGKDIGKVVDVNHRNRVKCRRKGTEIKGTRKYRTECCKTGWLSAAESFDREGIEYSGSCVGGEQRRDKEID